MSMIASAVKSAWLMGRGASSTSRWRLRGPTAGDPFHPIRQMPPGPTFHQRAKLGSVSAAADSSSAQKPPPPSPETQAKVAALLQQSEQLQAKGQFGAAIRLLKQGLEELEKEGVDAAMPILLLRQCLSSVLFSEGDYAAAAQEARAVHQAICRVSGHGSREATLFGLRLGIFEAASGELEQGCERIREGGALAGESLQKAIAQGRALQSQGAQGEELKEAETYTRKLLSAVAESAFYYTTFSVLQLGTAGESEALEENWERLEGAMLRGLSDMVKVLGPGAGEVRNALREHYRVVQELGGDSVVGPRLQKQRAKLLSQAGKL